MNNEPKTLISLRINSDYVDRIDMLAYQDDRSRNSVVNALIGEVLKIFEEEHGPINVNPSILEKIRNRRKRGSAERSSESD